MSKLVAYVSPRIIVGTVTGIEPYSNIYYNVNMEKSIRIKPNKLIFQETFISSNIKILLRTTTSTESQDVKFETELKDPDKN